MEAISSSNNTNLATKIFQETRDVMLNGNNDTFDQMLASSANDKHIELTNSVRDIDLSSETSTSILSSPTVEVPKVVTLPKTETTTVSAVPVSNTTNVVTLPTMTTKSETVTPVSQVNITVPADKMSINSIISEMAKKYNVPEKLIQGVVKAESNYNPKATSPVGAMGLMQLMPKTASWLGVKDAYDPRQNLEGGVKYLSQLLKKYDGNQTLTLAAYNAGPGNVDKYGGVPPFKETQNYVKKILG